MPGLSLDRLLSTHGRTWFYQVIRTERSTTSFTLISICIRVLTFRAGAYYVPVCQELLILFIIKLFTFPLFKYTLVV